MSDPINTSAPVDETSAPAAEQGAVQPPAETKTKTAAPAKSRSTKSKTTDDEPKHKCAFCGKVAVFEKSTVVGGREPVTYHGCDESERAIFEWMQATHADASTPAPVTSED